MLRDTAYWLDKWNDDHDDEQNVQNYLYEYIHDNQDGLLQSNNTRVPDVEKALLAFNQYNMIGEHSIDSSAEYLLAYIKQELNNYPLYNLIDQPYDSTEKNEYRDPIENEFIITRLGYKELHYKVISPSGSIEKGIVPLSYLEPHIPGCSWISSLTPYRVQIFNYTSKSAHTRGSHIIETDELTAILKAIEIKTKINYSSLDYQVILARHQRLHLFVDMSDSLSWKKYSLVTQQNTHDSHYINANITNRIINEIGLFKHKNGILALSVRMSSQRNFSKLESKIAVSKLPSVTGCSITVNWLMGDYGVTNGYELDSNSPIRLCNQNDTSTYFRYRHANRKTTPLKINDKETFKAIFPMLAIPDSGQGMRIALTPSIMNQLIPLIDHAPPAFANSETNEYVLYVPDSSEESLILFCQMLAVLLRIDPSVAPVCNELCNELIHYPHLQSQLQFNINKATDQLNNHNYQLLINKLPSASEKNIVSMMDVFIDKHGVDLFVDYISYAEVDTLKEGPLLRYKEVLEFCVFKGYTTVVSKLLALGVPTARLLNFLQIACDQNNVSMGSILLDYNHDLLLRLESKSILMFAKSREMVVTIIKKAEKLNCLEKLISIRDKTGRTVFHYACTPERVEVLRELVLIENFHRHININSFLPFVRSLYFKSPKEYHDIDELCAKLAPFYTENSSPSWNKKRNYIMRISDSMKIFKEFPSSDSPTLLKKEAIHRTIAEFHSLLSSPSFCIVYLQLINRELLRYYRKKHGRAFPSLDRSMVKFVKICGIEYPIPEEGYVGIEKKSALQEFLVSVLKQHGLSEKTYKWINFIPTEVADEMIRSGNFAVECRFGNGLFHNKIAHMLQIVILLYAIQDNKVRVDHRANVSIQDILHVLVSEESSWVGIKLWGRVLDAIINDGVVSFTDPFHLGSMIMLHAQQWDIESLSDYLVDTFCKGICKLVAAFNLEFILPVPLTIASFVKKVNETTLGNFNTLNLFKYVVKREEQREASPKNSLITVDINKQYAIVEKKYNIHALFQPAKIMQPCEAFIPLPYIHLVNRCISIDALAFDNEDLFQLFSDVMNRRNVSNANETQVDSTLIIMRLQSYILSTKIQPSAESPMYLMLQTLLNQKNTDGYTPLHQAIISNKIDDIYYLIERGVNLNTLSNENKTAMDLAVHLNKKDIANLLLEAGEDDMVKQIKTHQLSSFL